MVKLGIIVFANDGGIGIQTRRLTQMLKPERVMIVNTTAISQNKQQHYEWYKDYNPFLAKSFPPSNEDVKSFLPGLTHVICVENPYNFGLIYWGEQQGVKVLCQSNYEFCENLMQPWLPVPHKFLMPSYWKIEEMTKLFGKDKVMHLPPPIDPAEFKKARNINMKRKGKQVRFLHVIGTAAHLDRNGTLDLIEAVKKTKSDFKLVVKTQHLLSMDAFLDDPRVEYIAGNVAENNDLYEDFDALLLPRRWGGLSLTLNEAMMSGLPTIMTNISPQDLWLPQEWLIDATLKGSFTGRAPVEYYSVDHDKLAAKIDEFATMGRGKLNEEKKIAYKIATDSFSPEVLKDRYLYLFDDR